MLLPDSTFLAGRLERTVDRLVMRVVSRFLRVPVDDLQLFLLSSCLARRFRSSVSSRVSMMSLEQVCSSLSSYSISCSRLMRSSISRLLARWFSMTLMSSRCCVDTVALLSLFDADIDFDWLRSNGWIPPALRTEL